MLKLIKRGFRLKSKLSPDELLSIFFSSLGSLKRIWLNEALLRKVSEILKLDIDQLKTQINRRDLYNNAIIFSEDEKIGLVYSYNEDLGDLNLFLVFHEDMLDQVVNLINNLRNHSVEVYPTFYHQYYPVLIRESEPYSPTERELEVAELLYDKELRNISMKIVENKLDYKPEELRRWEDFLTKLSDNNLLKINFIAYCRESRERIFAGSGVRGFLELMKGTLYCPFCGKSIKDEEIEFKVIPTIFFSTILKKRLWFKALIHRIISRELPGAQFFLLPPDNERLVIFYKNLLMITEAFPKELNLLELQSLIREAEFLKANVLLLFPFEGVNDVVNKFLERYLASHKHTLTILMYNSLEEFQESWNHFKEKLDRLVIENIEMNVEVKLNLRNLLRMKLLEKEMTELSKLEDEIEKVNWEKLKENFLIYNDDLEILERGKGIEAIVKTKELEREVAIQTEAEKLAEVIAKPEPEVMPTAEPETEAKAEAETLMPELKESEQRTERVEPLEPKDTKLEEDIILKMLEEAKTSTSETTPETPVEISPEPQVSEHQVETPESLETPEVSASELGTPETVETPETAEDEASPRQEVDLGEVAEGSVEERLEGILEEISQDLRREEVQAVEEPLQAEPEPSTEVSLESPAETSSEPSLESLAEASETLETAETLETSETPISEEKISQEAGEGVSEEIPVKDVDISQGTSFDFKVEEKSEEIEEVSEELEKRLEGIIEELKDELKGRAEETDAEKIEETIEEKSPQSEEITHEEAGITEEISPVETRLAEGFSEEKAHEPSLEETKAPSEELARKETEEGIKEPSEESEAVSIEPTEPQPEAKPEIVSETSLEAEPQIEPQSEAEVKASELKAELAEPAEVRREVEETLESVAEEVEAEEKPESLPETEAETRVETSEVLTEIITPEKTSYNEIISYVNQILGDLKTGKLYQSGSLPKLRDFNPLLYDPKKRMVLIAGERELNSWLLSSYSWDIFVKLVAKLKAMKVKPISWLHLLDDEREWLIFSFGNMTFNLYRPSGLRSLRTGDVETFNEEIDKLLSRDEVVMVAGYREDLIPLYTYVKGGKQLTKKQQVLYGTSVINLKKVIDSTLREVLKDLDGYQGAVSYVLLFQDRILQLVDLGDGKVGAIWMAGYDTDLLRDNIRVLRSSVILNAEQPTLTEVS